MAPSINLSVGGVFFSLQVQDIARFPDCYFSHLLKDAWNPDPSAVVNLARDASIFRYVQHYLFAGDLDTKNIQNYDLETMLSIKREADFFMLHELMIICDQKLKALFQQMCSEKIDTHSSLFECTCVSESAAPPTDMLIRALAPLHHPHAATARLSPRGMKDAFFCGGNVDTFIGELKCYAGIAHESLNQLPYHNCIRISHNCGLIHTNTFGRLQRSFERWPFDQRDICIGGFTMYVYQKGSYCLRRSYEPHEKQTEKLLYIFDGYTGFTGGTITSRVNGHAVTIRKPGECMALQPYGTYSVDIVTSGVLVLLELTFQFSSAKPLSKKSYTNPHWTVHQHYLYRDGDTVVPCVRANILSSVYISLLYVDCVVVCLSRYYDVTHTDDNRRFCTERELLQGLDATLCSMLSKHYDVNVVTVYAARDKHYEHAISSYVLDYTAGVLDIDNCSAEHAEHTEHFKRMRCKIVAPPMGYGLIGTSGCENQWGSIVTGLMLARKKTVC